MPVDLERQQGQQERKLRLESCAINKSLTGVTYLFGRSACFLGGRSKKRNSFPMSQRIWLSESAEKQPRLPLMWVSGREWRPWFSSANNGESGKRHALRQGGKGRVLPYPISQSSARLDYEARRAAFMASRRVSSPAIIQRSEVTQSPPPYRPLLPEKRVRQPPRRVPITRLAATHSSRDGENNEILR